MTVVVESERITAESDSTRDITGTILGDDGQPVAGASVEIGGSTATTDEDGNFTVKGVSDGYYTMTVTDDSGRIISYTEIEIKEAEAWVETNDNGSYLVSAPGNTPVHLDITMTDDGRLAVNRVTTQSLPAETVH